MPDHREPTTPATTVEPPPFGSWPRLYAIVIGELALLIVLFTLFAQAFR